MLGFEAVEIGPDVGVIQAGRTENFARLEWEDLINSRSAQEIAALLEAEGDTAQRLRASMPFIQPPFFTEAITLRGFLRQHAPDEPVREKLEKNLRLATQTIEKRFDWG